MSLSDELGSFVFIDTAFNVSYHIEVDPMQAIL